MYRCASPLADFFAIEANQSKYDSFAISRNNLTQEFNSSIKEYIHHRICCDFIMKTLCRTILLCIVGILQCNPERLVLLKNCIFSCMLYAIGKKIYYSWNLFSFEDDFLHVNVPSPWNCYPLIHSANFLFLITVWILKG